MKKLLGIVVLGLFWSSFALAETWTCDNSRFGKAMYEVKDSEIILIFPNNDGRTFKITKDQRKYKISIFGEMSNKQTNFDYDIYMNHILNHSGYRFFQASFDPDEKGTVLSVNHDYFGTLITYIAPILSLKINQHYK